MFDLAGREVKGHFNVELIDNGVGDVSEGPVFVVENFRHGKRIQDLGDVVRHVGKAGDVCCFGLKAHAVFECVVEQLQVRFELEFVHYAVFSLFRLFSLLGLGFFREILVRVSFRVPTFDKLNKRLTWVW